MYTPEPISNKDLENKIDLNSKNVRIGMLRQWLNEERIKDAKYFVTNEDLELWLDPAFSQLENEARKVTGETSDGYHTFNELYNYRRVYNAALFNEWYQQGGKHSVHKSWRHSDGELCFDGGWFVVVAELPTGQITNHYESKYWNDFQIPEQKTANTYDGHTPKEALDRIATLNKENE